MKSLEAWRSLATPMDFSGHRIQVYEGGKADGPAMLLIHGFPTAAWDWHKMWPTLAEKYRLVAPDLIGFGYSDKPTGFPYSFRAQADLCEAALSARRISHYHILCHDYGDTVAQEILARQIERDDETGPLSACLLNGGIFPESQQPILIQRLLAGPLGPMLVRFLNQKVATRSLKRVFGPDTPPSPEESEAFWQLMSHNGGERIVHRILAYLEERRQNSTRWVGALTSARVPLMLIDGLLDPVSGTNMTAKWKELLPNAPLVELAEVGHYPQMEAPERVLEGCVPFFESAR
jgi:pimeloyl-ACP methyl ester carboxylesterase